MTIFVITVFVMSIIIISTKAPHPSADMSLKISFDIVQIFGKFGIIWSTGCLISWLLVMLFTEQILPISAVMK